MREPFSAGLGGRRLPALALIGMALIMSACNQSSSPKPGDPPFTEAQEKRLRQIFKEEFAAMQLTDGKVVTDSRKVREEIDKMVLAKVEEELAKGTWKGQVDGGAVVNILQRLEKVAKNGNSYEVEAVDLSQFPTVDGKITRVMQEFEGVRSYSADNALVKQLKELGPQAKPQLYKALQDARKEGGGNWAGVMALAETLKPLLTVDDKGLLLEDLQSSNPQLTDVVRKLHIDEAGDLALNKLRDLSGKPEEFMNAELMNIALEFKEEEALPLVLDRLGKPGSNSASWVAQTLDTKFPDLDITAQLRVASTKISNPYDSSTFSQLMLKRGMPEGLALAADTLLRKSPEMGGNDYNREQVRSSLRRYVNVTGSDEEVAQWLLDNRTKLHWNASSQMFEE